MAALPRYEPQARVVEAQPVFQPNLAERALEPAARELAQAAAEERAYWEHGQAARVQADVYRLGEDYRQRIESGDLAGADEATVRTQFVQDVEKRLANVHPRVRARAQAQLAQMQPYIEGRLYDLIQERRAQQGQADVLDWVDVSMRYALSAEDDADALEIEERGLQAVRDTGYLNPIQKQKILETAHGDLWVARYGQKAEQPGADLEALRAESRTRGLSFRAQQEIEKIIDTRGRAVQRAQVLSDLENIKNIYIAAQTPQERAEIEDGTVQYLNDYRAIFEPEEYERLVRGFRTDIRKGALYRDEQDHGPGWAREALDTYGFAEDEKTAMGEYLDNRIEQQRNDAIRAEETRDRARQAVWTKKYANRLMELTETPDEAQIDRVMTDLKFDHEQGFRGAAQFWMDFNTLKREYLKGVDLNKTIAYKNENGWQLSKDEADHAWGTLGQAARKVDQRPVDGQDVVEFVGRNLRIPTPILLEIESVAVSGTPGKVREWADVIRLLPAGVASTQISEPAQAVYRGVTAQSADEEISARRKWVYEAKEEDLQVRASTFQSGGAEKQARQRFAQGMRSAEGLKEKFDITERELPQTGFPASDDPTLPEMEQLYVARTQKNYELSPAASLEDAGRVALRSVLQEYNPFWNGREWRWMRLAPGLAVADPELINEHLEEFLQAHGYTLESERYRRMAAAGAAGMQGEAGAVEIPAEAWTPTRVSLLPVGEEGGAATYYVSVWDAARGWTVLQDAQNRPYLWGGAGLVQAMRDKRDRLATEYAEQQRAERESEQRWRERGQPVYPGFFRRTPMPRLGGTAPRGAGRDAMMAVE
jgi:hypothetical protein